MGVLVGACSAYLVDQERVALLGLALNLGTLGGMEPEEVPCKPTTRLSCAVKRQGHLVAEGQLTRASLSHNKVQAHTLLAHPLLDPMRYLALCPCVRRNPVSMSEGNVHLCLDLCLTQRSRHASLVLCMQCRGGPTCECLLRM